MIKKINGLLKNKRDKLFVRMNEFIGFSYVGDDRGAMEFVATNDRMWEKRVEISGLESLDAFTFCGSIFWPSRESMRRQEVLKHELSHVDDYNKLGFILHAVLYGLCDTFYGYENNPFEIKARLAEME